MWFQILNGIVILTYSLNIFWRDWDKVCFVKNNYAIPFTYSTTEQLLNLREMAEKPHTGVINVT